MANIPPATTGVCPAVDAVAGWGWGFDTAGSPKAAHRGVGDAVD